VFVSPQERTSSFGHRQFIKIEVKLKD